MVKKEEGQVQLGQWLFELMLRNRKRLVELLWEETTHQDHQS